MLVHQKPGKHRSLSSAATVHQPGNRTQKFPHATCRLLVWNYLVPHDCQEMVIPHLLVYKVSAFPVTLNYSPPLCSHSPIFFAIFVHFSSNSVWIFLLKWCYYLWMFSFHCEYSSWFLLTVTASITSAYREVLICRWNRKWELFSPHRFPFAQTIPAKSLWSKKPNHTIGVNSLLDCMAAFWAVLYLSDESIRSQVNHQSLQKRKHCCEMYLKTQKTFICSLVFNSKRSSAEQASTWIEFLLWNEVVCFMKQHEGFL